MVWWRTHRLFVFGSLFFFFGNLILHTVLATTFLGPYADRYVYLSVLGLWLAAWSLVPESRRTVAVRAGSAAAVEYAGLAFAQTQHWRSTIDLWTHNLTHESATFSNGMGEPSISRADNSPGRSRISKKWTARQTHALNLRNTAPCVLTSAL